jgi:hypothetical protein
VCLTGAPLLQIWDALVASAPAGSAVLTKRRGSDLPRSRPTSVVQLTAMFVLAEPVYCLESTMVLSIETRPRHAPLSSRSLSADRKRQAGLGLAALLSSLQGKQTWGAPKPPRFIGHVPAGRRSTQAARVQGDPPRPGPSTSSQPFRRFHRPRPYCAGGERSAPFIPEGRRQTVSPGESQSGGARAVTEAESGFGEASCLRRSLCHGLRSDRVPGPRGAPAPDFSTHAARL